jgi:F0F1-type ATP synthase delta subunit
VLEEVAYQALMDGADARGQLSRVQDELFSFARVLEVTRARAALTDPALPSSGARGRRGAARGQGRL